MENPPAKSHTLKLALLPTSGFRKWDGCGKRKGKKATGLVWKTAKDKLMLFFSVPESFDCDPKIKPDRSSCKKWWMRQN